MKTLEFSILVNAPVEKVWEVMLADRTYRIWTEPFMPGSHFDGSWDEGSKIKFLAADKDGKLGGMVSRIKENTKHEKVVIEHLGMVKNGVEDTTSDEVNSWKGALEKYFFKEKDGKTEVKVEVDTDEAFGDEFQKMWLKALQKLKEIAESA